MKIIQRYIFRELLLPFLVSALTLSFIFMAGYMVRAANFIIGRGVPLTDTLYVLLLALPDMVSYTIPMSLLTAVMIVFGNLSQYNEIRAFKASGVNPYQIMLPAFVIGIVLSLGMFVFNDQVATEAGFALRKTTKQLLVKHPKALVEPGRFVKLNDQVLFLTKQVEGDKLRDIVAYEVGEGDEPIRTIIAESGEIITLPGQSAMQIKLYNGSVSDAKTKEVQSIQFQTYEFPAYGQEDIANMKKKMRDFTLAELLVKKENQDVPASELSRFWTAFHERIAFSLGSFIFVFVGVPIAILVRRGEIVLSFAISMAAASLYYILFVGAKTLSIRGYLPAPVALWIPNALLLLAGARLLRKSVNS
ncbi:MAG: YjgP/YjgQ family permease [Candidatus Omnitrophica bacterium]|nr:YjgP/YjgQ family permease [Candidatus Omnitrophota bacterium]